MVRYFTHRLTEAAIVLLLMSFCIYGLLGLMPGDPIDLMLSGDPNVTNDGPFPPALVRYSHNASYATTDPNECPTTTRVSASIRRNTRSGVAALD